MQNTKAERPAPKTDTSLSFLSPYCGHDCVRICNCGVMDLTIILINTISCKMKLKKNKGCECSMKQPSPWWPGNILIYIITDYGLFSFHSKTNLTNMHKLCGEAKKQSCLCWGHDALITCQGVSSYFGPRPVHNPWQVISASCPQHRVWFLKPPLFISLSWYLLVVYGTAQHVQTRKHYHLDVDHIVTMFIIQVFICCLSNSPACADT